MNVIICDASSEEISYLLMIYYYDNFILAYLNLQLKKYLV